MKLKGPHEKVLQKALLARYPSAIPDLALFARFTGVVKTGSTTQIAGVPGQADLWGVWTGAIHIEIELKSVNGKLSKDQIAWKQYCLVNGIPHLVLQAWTGETVEDTVERWIQKIQTARPVAGTVSLQIMPRTGPIKASASKPTVRKQITWLPGTSQSVKDAYEKL